MRPGTEKVPGSRAEGAREGGAIQGKKPGGAPLSRLGGLRLPRERDRLSTASRVFRRPEPRGQAGLAGLDRWPAAYRPVSLHSGRVGTASGRGYDVDMTVDVPDSIQEVPMKNVNLEEWTYEDYLTLPEGGPFRYEIIDGELCMTPSPNTKHQKISRNILHFIDSFLRQNTVGEIFYAPYDVVFSQDPLQVAEPDLVFVSKARAAIITEKNIQGVPDLLIEILSPTTAANDRRVKRTLYERFGVPEYWIVDPEAETVQVFRLSDGRYGTCLEFRKEDALDSPLLPGLSIPLSGVFPV